MKALPQNLIVISGESFNLDGKTPAVIEEHFAKYQSVPTVKDPVYVWPEALVTFKRPNQTQQAIVEEIFSKHFSGTHYYGAYTVKENVPASSTNKYFLFDTLTKNKAEFNKAFPVPFQEASDFFWFIPKDKIGLSFNVETSRKFSYLKFQDKKIAIYLCNEIGEMKQILNQYPDGSEFILVPSNTPVQNTEFYEDVLDFYSRILAKIKRTPLIKVSSHGHIYVIEKDHIRSYKQAIYQTGNSK